MRATGDNGLAYIAQYDGVAVLTINNPPVNALGIQVRRALIEAIDETTNDPAIHALVICCEGRTFFAGADIREFDRPPASPELPDVVNQIEDCPKPVIAAIHGTVLGGGLEVAMGCHFRVAVDSAKFGLPETKLGLMPGAGGTQRLPRLVGVEKALHIIAFGRTLPAAQALRDGLIDKVVEGDLVGEAIDFARSVCGTKPRRTRDIEPPLADGTVFDRFLALNARKFRRLDAPPAIARAVRAAIELPFEQGSPLERELFVQLREGQQSKALRHLFFAEREAAKIPDVDPVTVRGIERIGIVGAGTMGARIAVNLLLSKIPVTLVEQTDAALARGLKAISETIEADVEKGRVSHASGAAAAALLVPSVDYSELADCELIIEAAFESMDVKRAIFTKLDLIAKPQAILATNTSYLDVDEIAAATSRPSDVVGLHFFSPANVMKLLEIVRGRATRTDVVATVLSLAKRIGKLPVVAGNCHGFIGNRMLAVRRREAEQMVLAGASPWEIDRVAEEFGFPMGPFRVSDLAGLDLGWSPDTSTGATIRDRLCESGRRGQKSDAGYYDYDANGRASPSTDVEAIITRLAADLGLEQRKFSDDEILARLVWPMVDEGAQILAEGIAQRASDIDVVWVHGYGWPAWNGGPMFYSKTVGFSRITQNLIELGYRPSAALQQLATTVEAS